jgi:hypothetical protein
MAMSPELLAQLRSGRIDDIPAIASERDKADYAAMAQKLHDGLRERGLSAEERAVSPEGRLASALWQRVADWDDAREQEDD